MDREPLERIDSFPYRHKVADLMSAPAITIEAGADVQTAARRMREKNISSLVVLDEAGRPAGLVTERDLLWIMAERGAAAVSASVRDVMTSPVHTIGADNLVYLAIARMDRLGIRHLAVVDDLGRVEGVISARALLRQRASEALAIGDEIDEAKDGPALAAAHRRLPALARALLAEGVPAVQIAGVIAGITRDIHTRVAALVEGAMNREGRGAAPAAWCFLVLGSAGRGESLLSADQDNALIHAWAEDDHPWFVEFATRATDMLNDAGIPYCNGDVMARHSLWRHNLPEWQARVDSWVADPQAEKLLAVDIFLDFRPVAGDPALAHTLRQSLIRATTSSPMFLQAMSSQLHQQSNVLGLFNRFRTEAGRIDLKRDGLLALVSGARVLSLKAQSAALPSSDRLAAAARAGLLEPRDELLFREAHERFLRVILNQQIQDMARGLPPTTKVDVRALNPVIRERLRDALKEIDVIDLVVRNALEGRPVLPR
jgi:CBS domain-containing protein